MTSRADVAALHGFADAHPALSVVGTQADSGSRRTDAMTGASETWPGEYDRTDAATDAGIGRSRLRTVLITLAALLLAGLAAAMGVVSWHGQYGFIYALKHQHLSAALEALGPDCGAVIFAILGVALALSGRRAITERFLVVACSALSVLMNLGAANLGSPRAIGVYVLPPALFAVTSDRLIAVIRASALRKDDSRSAWQVMGRALVLPPLYLLRLLADFKGTKAGIRQAILDATPLPEVPEPVAEHKAIAAPERKAIAASPATAARKPRKRKSGRKRGAPTKTEQLLSLAAERHDLKVIPLDQVSRIATGLATEAGLHPGTARRVLIGHVRALQNGAGSD